MKMLSNIYWFLYIVFHPEYWSLRGNYNHEWNKRVEHILENKIPFERRNKYTALIDNELVWVDEWIGMRVNTRYRPSRKNIIKFKKYYELCKDNKFYRTTLERVIKGDG